MAKMSSFLLLRPSYRRNAVTMCSVGLSSSYGVCYQPRAPTNHRRYRIPGAGSRLSDGAHIPCEPRRARPRGDGRRIWRHCSRSAGIRLRGVNHLARTREAGRGTFVAGGDVEEGAQGVVYDLVFLAARRHDVVELCGGSQLACVLCQWGAWHRNTGAGAGALTIPELLLILETVRHLKCHVVVPGQLLEPSSPATQATVIAKARRRHSVGVWCFAAATQQPASEWPRIHRPAEPK